MSVLSEGAAHLSLTAFPSPTLHGARYSFRQLGQLGDGGSLLHHMGIELVQDTSALTTHLSALPNYNCIIIITTTRNNSKQSTQSLHTYQDCHLQIHASKLVQMQVQTAGSTLYLNKCWQMPQLPLAKTFAAEERR